MGHPARVGPSFLSANPENGCSTESSRRGKQTMNSIPCSIVEDDNFNKEIWSGQLPQIPEIGSLIGIYNAAPLPLKVVRVAWTLAPNSMMGSDDSKTSVMVVMITVAPV
jgi:hypothetical protein